MVPAGMLQRLGRRRHPGVGDGAARGGGDDQAGGHRPRDVVQQADRERPGQVQRVVKLIWIHCPPALPGLASVQAVDGSPSKALTGSACGTSQSQDPAEDAVTLAAPVSTATVWCPAVPVGQQLAGRLAARAVRVVRRVRAGRGVGIGGVVVRQAEGGVGAAEPVGDVLACGGRVGAWSPGPRSRPAGCPAGPGPPAAAARRGRRRRAWSRRRAATVAGPPGRAAGSVAWKISTGGYCGSIASTCKAVPWPTGPVARRLAERRDPA